ncbi:MAG: hypothetical protein HC780_15040 [Leptolyngbyaceae cyanobacterium CSU_1_3]|nr:hypothetical protein [Leptolyngbyaceae cyanobacterium CSU_1_3]
MTLLKWYFSSLRVINLKTGKLHKLLFLIVPFFWFLGLSGCSNSQSARREPAPIVNSTNSPQPANSPLASKPSPSPKKAAIAPNQSPIGQKPS